MNQPPPPPGPPTGYPPGGPPFPPAAAPPPPEPSPGAPPRSGGPWRVALISAGAALAAYVVFAAAIGFLVYSGGPEDVQVADGPHALPEEPCAGATVAQLADLSAQLPTSTTDDTAAICSWYVDFADGTSGGLTVSYRIYEEDQEGDYGADGSTAAEVAREQFDQDKTIYTEGTLPNDLAEGAEVEVQDYRRLNLGEESFLSSFRETLPSLGGTSADEAEPTSSMRVMVLHDNMTVRAEIGEPRAEEGSGSSGPDPDYSDHEELLIGIAAEALENLG